MVTNYEFLINSKELDLFIKRGLISERILDLMQIYKYFLDEMRDNKNQKLVCYLSTAEHFNISERSVQRVVKMFT